MPRISDLPLTSSVDEATAFVAVSAGGVTYKISLANALAASTGATFFDSDSSHIITLAGGSNLSANRTLTLTTGNADRTLDISAGDTTISAFAITFLDDADAAAVRSTLGLQIGVDVQAYDPDLAAIAALTPTDNGVIIGNGASFVVESGATLRTSLGIRERLAAARTYYVRTDGSDSNTGLTDNAGGAFLTIQAAVNAAFALDFNGYAVTIQVRSGTYTGQVSINDLPPGCTAANPLIIQGDTSTPSNVVISTTSQHAITVSSGAEAYIQGFKIQTTTSGIGIQVSAHARVVIAAMDFGACATYHTEVKDGANAIFTGNYTISGGAIAHQHCTSNGYILYTGGTITLTGTPAFSSYFVGVNNAYVQYGTTTFSGAATGIRHYVHNNASIYTDGSYDANFFPGSIAGILAGASCIDDYDGSIVLSNTGLQIDDTDASHQLSIVPGSNLTADRTLTIITGNANRTLDFSAGSFAPTAFGLDLIDSVDASAARTVLGLGTAAVQNTGTSGATIPFLNGANTWSGQQIIDLSASSPLANGLVVQSTEDSASGGPGVLVRRISASPAASDQLGFFQFQGRDSGGNNTIYASVSADIIDPTDTSEDGSFSFNTIKAGTVSGSMTVRIGAFVGSPTGSDMGTGTLNAVTLYENGTALTAKYGQLGANNTWTGIQTISTASATAALVITSSASFAIPITIESTNGDALAGPFMNFQRLSPSPAATDLIGGFNFRAYNASLVGVNYCTIQATAFAVTAGAETGRLQFNTFNAGSFATVLSLRAGAFVGSPTGFDMGVGTLNAVTLYENGTALTAKYGQLAVQNTWTANQVITKASPVLQMNGTSGDANFYISAVSGNAATSRWGFWNGSAYVDRWLFGKDATAESGSNAGSDFAIYSYTDAGSFLGTVLTINRANSGANFRGGVFSNTASGGNQGTDTLNFVTIYENGTSLASKYGRLASGNTWSSANTFTTTSSFGAPVTLQSTNADANEGPFLLFRRGSASPANNDRIGSFLWQMYTSDSPSTYVTTAAMTVYVPVEVSSSGTATIAFNTRNAGSYTDRVYISGGLFTAGATGSDMGANTINAGTLYESGTSLAAKYARLGSANTFTSPQRLPSYTVAGLPAGAAGDIAFTSNGRKNGEGAGLGTGVLVFHDGTAWRACDTGATVAA